MTLAELIASHALTHALIVDDAYDEVPRASDLASEGREWSTFFADLSADEIEILAANVPRYLETDATVLMNNDLFVATVWGLRDKLRGQLWGPVFERFSRTREHELQYLHGLEGALKGLSIEPVRGLRHLPNAGRTEPIIFADLFLGSEQTETDMTASIERLRRLLEGRAANPPLVILMSRSPRLRSKKSSFRDRAGVLGSMFRVQTKEALLAGDTLARTIERLARHRSDALKIARFIETWRTELDGARERFLTTMRRLDLADYGQIQQLLLEFEGQPLGSYLLDVFDRVLEHEIEASQDTIDAAEALNEIDAKNYPAPYIAGSPDLQSLLSRVIYQHAERLRVRSTKHDVPVSFGDVLVRRTLRQEEFEAKRKAKAEAKKLGAAAELLKQSTDPAAALNIDREKIGSVTEGADKPTVALADQGDDAAHQAKPEVGTVTAAEVPPTPSVEEDKEGEGKPETDDVLVVLTPACDLVRGGAKRVMMMTGALEELTPESWIYRGAGLRTPFITLDDKRRMWIKWDVKDIQTLSAPDVTGMLEPGGTHVRLVRLRESHALELQQQLLSSLGRVGLVAQMPASFPVDVELWSCGVDGQSQRQKTPILDDEGGVCLFGRDESSGSIGLLRMSEDACDEILLAITQLEETNVHPSANVTLGRAKDASFARALERGLHVPSGGWSALNILTGKLNAKNEPLPETVGLVARNPKSMDVSKGQLRHSCVILILKDRPSPDIFSPSASKLTSLEGDAVQAAAASTSAAAPAEAIIPDLDVPAEEPNPGEPAPREPK